MISLILKLKIIFNFKLKSFLNKLIIKTKILIFKFIDLRLGLNLTKNLLD